MAAGQKAVESTAMQIQERDPAFHVPQAEREEDSTGKEEHLTVLRGLSREGVRREKEILKGQEGRLTGQGSLLTDQEGHSEKESRSEKEENSIRKKEGSPAATEKEETSAETEISEEKGDSAATDVPEVTEGNSEAREEDSMPKDAGSEQRRASAEAA